MSMKKLFDLRALDAKICFKKAVIVLEIEIDIAAPIKFKVGIKYRHRITFKIAPIKDDSPIKYVFSLL